MKIRKADYDSRRLADWFDRVVIVWQEDDARPPGRETGPAAWVRITDREYPLSKDRIFSSWDGGDCGMTLHDSGWVYGSSCEGGFVGIVAEVFE